MRHRAFILLLAGALILATGLLHNAADATPFSGGALLGDHFPLWELRAAIPFGIFSAGLFVALVGMSAQLVRGAYQLCQHGSAAAATTARRIATAALWCGWPFVLCCTNALLYIAPRFYIPGLEPAPNHLEALRPLLHYQLYGALAAMLLCRMSCIRWPHARLCGAFCIILPLAALLSTDILWGSGHFYILWAALPVFPAVILLSRPGIISRCGGSLLLAVAAAVLGISLQHRPTRGLFPTGTADYVFYLLSLALILVLMLLKIADIRYRNSRA